MNSCNFIGNVTKDAELNYASGKGTPILKFSIAVARGYKKEDGTDFINCTLMGSRAEGLSSYVLKGTKVAVNGKLRINSYDKKDGTKGYSTEILIGEIELLGGKKQETTQDTFGNPFGADITPVDDSDDIPF